MRPSDEIVIVVTTDGAVYAARCWRSGELIESGECVTLGAALEILGRKLADILRHERSLGEVT